MGAVILAQPMMVASKVSVRRKEGFHVQLFSVLAVNWAEEVLPFCEAMKGMRRLYFLAFRAGLRRGRGGPLSEGWFYVREFQVHEGM